MFGYISPYWLRFQCKLDAIPLIFVQLTIFVFLFTLILERDDNETDEYVNHKKGNYNNVNNVVGGYDWTEIFDWAPIFGVWVDGHI